MGGECWWKTIWRGNIKKKLEVAWNFDPYDLLRHENTLVTAGRCWERNRLYWFKQWRWFVCCQGWCCLCAGILRKGVIIGLCQGWQGEFNLLHSYDDAGYSGKFKPTSCSKWNGYHQDTGLNPHEIQAIQGPFWPPNFVVVGLTTPHP